MASADEQQCMQALEQGADQHGLWRRVRFPDGTERVQRAQITVQGAITRADGTVEPGAEIIDIRTGD
jgi:hypothetical protein